MDKEERSVDQLWTLIKDIKFAMFTTRQEDGYLHSRPMTTQISDTDRTSLWFFMSHTGGPVDELALEPGVNLSYADPDKDTYVSVTGTAHLSHDMAKTRSLWTKAAQAWFPGGVDDPDLALVEVKITHAHYWDVKESKITQILLIAKAVAVGEQAQLGESVEVVMR